VLKHYTPNIDTSLLEKSYDNCGCNMTSATSVIDALIGWMKEDVCFRSGTYEDAVDTSLADSYPGLSGYEN